MGPNQINHVTEMRRRFVCGLLLNMPPDELRAYVTGEDELEGRRQVGS